MSTKITTRATNQDTTAHTSTPRQAAIVLSISQLGKEYKLYASPRDRLRALLTGVSRHSSHWALQGVSFDLTRGQCLGVVGDNGAGKSSLLKLITGTIQPTLGTVTRHGRITAILELGAGFHPDFTGRENLYFSGSLIGIDAHQMKELEPQIAEFCELGAALDRPVKTYSSGMVVRLAFAVVTAVEPDVLIIDEALAVGDQHFQMKCTSRIEAFRQNGCTILFCSHSLYHIRHLCDSVLWLDGGKLRAIGQTEAVLSAYETHVRAKPTLAALSAPVSDDALDAVSHDAPASTARPSLPGTEMATFSDVPPGPAAHSSAALVSVSVAQLKNSELAGKWGGEPATLMSPDLSITVVAQLPAGQKPSIGVMLEQWQGVGITSVASHAESIDPVQRSDGLWTLTLTFPNLPLHSGTYVLSAYLFDERGVVIFDEWKNHIVFKHVTPNLTPGLVQLPHHWHSTEAPC